MSSDWQTFVCQQFETRVPFHAVKEKTKWDKQACFSPVYFDKMNEAGNF